MCICTIRRARLERDCLGIRRGLAREITLSILIQIGDKGESTVYGLNALAFLTTEMWLTLLISFRSDRDVAYIARELSL